MSDPRTQMPEGGSDGELPPVETKRWVVRRKALIVSAVRTGALSLDDACRRYALTVEEFLAWQNAIERHGLAGLRATRRHPRKDPASSATPPAREIDNHPRLPI